MGKVELIAELSHLSREDFADVRAWMDRHAPKEALSTRKLELPANAVAQVPSAFLADPSQAWVLKKTVKDLPRDDASL